MAILIPNYDLAQKIGSNKIEIEASTIGQLIEIGISRYGEPFKQAVESAAVVLNGRNISLLKGRKTKLGKTDQVWLLLPSSGG